MKKTASTLSSQSRGTICDELNYVLADGIDLFTQVKVAHWNIKGPLFAQWHPLLDEFAGALNEHNDAIAERAVILGGTAYGTARYVANNSRLSEYGKSTTKDMDHIKALSNRFAKYAKNLVAVRQAAEKLNDAVTADLLTEVISDIEKKSWFLLSTLEK